MEYDIQIKGSRELELALRGFDDAFGRHIIGRGLFEMAKIAGKTAKANAPVLTGAYRRSIRARRTSARFQGKKVPGGSAALFAGGIAAPHAHLIEFGTVRQSANPVLSNAIIASKNAQYAGLVRASSRELDRQVKRLAAGMQTRTITRLVTGG